MEKGNRVKVIKGDYTGETGEILARYSQSPRDPTPMTENSWLIRVDVSEDIRVIPEGELEIIG